MLAKCPAAAFLQGKLKKTGKKKKAKPNQPESQPEAKPNQPESQPGAIVDIYVEDEKDVWSALDEGCNSTVYLSYWADEMEKRLRKQGMDMPWIIREIQRFIGLASNAVTGYAICNVFN